MKKKTNIQKEQLRKLAHAAAQRKYYAKKTGDKAAEKKAASDQKRISKDLRKTEKELEQAHKHRTTKRAYIARKNYQEALQDTGTTKKELKKLFSKITQANTEKNEAYKVGKEGEKRVRKGRVKEKYTQWSAHDLVNKIMVGSLKYQMYQDVFLEIGRAHV